jgi:hypothetical protein
MDVSLRYPDYGFQCVQRRLFFALNWIRAVRTMQRITGIWHHSASSSQANGWRRWGVAFPRPREGYAQRVLYAARSSLESETSHGLRCPNVNFTGEN